MESVCPRQMEEQAMNSKTMLLRIVPPVIDDGLR